MREDGISEPAIMSALVQTAGEIARSICGSDTDALKDCATLAASMFMGGGRRW
jgi:hypothetical protein